MKAILTISALSHKVPKEAKFCIAVMKVMSHPDYDEKLMIEQMKKYGQLLRRQVNTEAYIDNLEEVYNYRRNTENKIRLH